MKRSLCLLALWAMAAAAFASGNAAITLYPAAKVAVPELGVPVGVRAVGMGEAYTAAGRDVTMLQWNPAGLARIPGYQLSLMHNEWASTLGMRQEFLAYGQGLGSDSGLGVSLDYFSLGQLTSRDDNGALLGQSTGAYAMSGSVGYGMGLLSGDALKIGAAAEFAQESLFSSGSSAFGGSLGVLWDAGKDLSFGASLMHAGAAGGGFSPPTEAHVGTAYSFNERALVLALDGDYPLNGNPGVRAGAEVNFSGMSLRGGWRQNFGAPEGDVSSGFSAGMGFKAGVFALDYAFVPYGDLSSVHRIAVSVDLPADFFRPKVIGAESSTTTAKSYYNKALAERKQGNSLQALVQFQRAKDAYPEALVRQNKAQDFYKDTLKQIEGIQKQMASSGNNENLRRAVTRKINDGQDAMKSGRFMEAISLFRDAVNLDPAETKAAELLKQAQSAFSQRKRELLGEGEEAYNSGQLNAAIQKYREVLQLDRNDETASGFFANHKAEIKENLTKIHRKGIDLYLGGHIREAVGVWKDGLKLDPSDPINFRRDIEKAEKVLEVKGDR